MPKVIIMLGVTGSGKTTWANQNYPDAVMCSTDNFFRSADDVYKFNPVHLPDAHLASLDCFMDNVGESDVVVDNVNACSWELAPYVAIAQVYASDKDVKEETTLEIVYMDATKKWILGHNHKNVVKKTLRRQFNNIQTMLENWPKFWPDVRVIPRPEE